MPLGGSAAFVSMCASGGKAGTQLRIRMNVMYDGTDFEGWQRQARKGSRSIQGELERVLQCRLQTPVQVVGASRTDTGVHATGQVAHFDVPEDRMEDLDRMQFALNHMLCPDVRVAGLEHATTSPSKKLDLPFHAMFDSRGKVYTYRFKLGTFVSPLERRTRALVWQKCDLDALDAALQRFVGEHDFTSFANNAKRGVASVNPVRRVRSVQLEQEGRDSFCARFELDGALHRMVRNVMGMAFAVAAGKRSLADIEAVFQARDRCLAPKAADACGLCLERVLYDV